NLMIRATVQYDVSVPVLTAPEDLVTNEESVTISGITSPNVDVKIYQNGTEIAVVQSNSSGSFETAATLVEGENVFTAKAFVNHGSTNLSNELVLTLDLTAPELTVNTAEEIVGSSELTVTGTVYDEHLDKVTV